MPRLIDADAFLDKVLKQYTEHEKNGKLMFSACEIKQAIADMVTDAPTIDPAPQWIPVTERLPEADGEYLCYFEDGGCCAVHFDETEQAFGEWIKEFDPDTLGWCDEHFEEFQGVTHWKLLQKPTEDGGAE